MYSTLENLLLIFISAAFINNIVLSYLLGLCPFLGVSKNKKTSQGVAVATMFILSLGSGISHLVYHHILVPLNLEFIKALCFIVIIAAMVQITEILIEAGSPILYRSMGIFLPLITTNCAVLGVPLLSIQYEFTFIEALTFGMGHSIGFSVILYIFSELRERLEAASIPTCFKGTPIALITAGIMSLAFLGLGGITRG